MTDTPLIPERTGPQHPEWAKNATIYQLNTRQFTREGTFRAAAEHLPRLQELGVSILWIMPVHAIGECNRKGRLGSQYAVRDYYSVNPEFGTLDDFTHFVGAAHEHGMKVLLDWVANHTAWDNVLVEQHPEWYARDWKGDFRPTPWFDWDDIIDLDYRRPGLRRYMSDAMAWWVRETGIDGFRCDVAGMVPLDFWEDVRTRLDAIKPVFMLAEWEARDLHARAFDMTYAWSWNESMHRIATGAADVGALRIHYAWDEGSFPADAIRMTFVSNHDHNAWEGTEFEKFGDALEAAVVLSMTGHGMPLIYNGQEAGSDKRLAFFERDPIVWREHPMGDFYQRLVHLRRENSALWTAPWGARMLNVPNSAPEHVLSFVRRNAEHRVLVVLNLSSEHRQVDFGETLHHGRWRDFFSGDEIEVDDRWTLALDPWGYRLLVQGG